MRLNTLKPSIGAKKQRVRVGRGIGSGYGKTCARGHKGQTSRTGTGKNSPGFEGGQMPMHRRLPKFGFVSRKALVSQELNIKIFNSMDVGQDIVNLEFLKKHSIISNTVKFVKLIGEHGLNQALHVQGLKATKGAEASIVKAGGRID